MIRLIAILTLLASSLQAQRYTPMLGVNYRYAHKQRFNFIQWSRMDFAPTFGLDHSKYMITYSFTTTNISHNIQILYKFKKNKIKWNI